MARAWLGWIVIWAAGVGLAMADTPSRYIGEFADGTRISGERITDWHLTGQKPRLDDTNLADPKRPLRWLRDTTLSPWQPTSLTGGFVEFHGGDRLPGKIVGFVPSSSASWKATPATLIVHPTTSYTYGHQPIRVLVEEIARVVFQTNASRPLRPGTLFYRNGRKLTFRSIRWGEKTVTVLTPEGMERIATSDIAEIHLPGGDPWQRYFRRVAKLSPDGTGRLIRLETTDGLIVTGLDSRLHAFTRHDPSKSDYWHHGLQPAWAFEPMWMQFSTIRMRRSFALNEMPLSQLQPVDSKQDSWLGASWTWQKNRNVRGGELQSAGEPYAWGFGVHATNTLVFDLHPSVEAFESWFGMDQSVGDGGCARAIVSVGDANLDESRRKPLFKSPILIGSETVYSTGTLKIPDKIPGDGKPHQLILVADAAHEDRPAGADPFDVRDHVDWLQPVVLLSREKLQAEIRKHARELIAAWEGWTVSVEGGGPVPVDLRWDDSNYVRPVYMPVVVAGKKPITLSQERKIGESDRWLRLHLRQVFDWRTSGQVEVRVDGAAIAQMRIVHHGNDSPWLVPLTPFAGKRVKMEVVFTPNDASEAVEWCTMAITGGKTPTNWQPLKVAAMHSQGGATLSELEDGSILAGGKNPSVDTYELRVETELPEISAIRLEVLPHESLPGHGPGRSFYGNFILSQFRLMKPPGKHKTVSGRYVRMDLPGTNQVINLAEVEVFVGEKNVALAGKASQSTTEPSFDARNAIDGKTEGRWDKHDITRTLDGQSDPWWEVDLGRTCDIDRIVVWNRTDKTLGQRVKNFSISVLDERRKLAWRRAAVSDAPAPAMEFMNRTEEPVVIKKVVGDAYMPALALNTMMDGWEVRSPPGQPHVAVFTLEKPVDARKGLIVTMRHAQNHHSLGRFRLLATGDPPPIPVEPIGLEVPPWREGEPVPKAPSLRTPPLPEMYQKGLDATVLVVVEGRRGSGVLIRKTKNGDPFVLTCGHLMVDKNKDATIYLRGGRKLQGKTLGIFRDADLGLIKLLDVEGDEDDLKTLELAQWPTLDYRNRYAGFTIGYDVGTGSRTDRPMPDAYVGVIYEESGRTYRASTDRHTVFRGGAMLDIEGRVAGIQTIHRPHGLPQFTHAHYVYLEWDRLVRGDVWGRWQAGSGPMMGVITTGNRVVYLFPDSPAQKAGLQLNDIIEKLNGQPVQNYSMCDDYLAEKMVGDEVTIDVRRGKDETFTKKIKLMPRTAKR